MSEPGIDSVSAWSRYWNSAQLAACLGADDGNYGGVIREAWEDFFAQAEPGSTVVDLATGNGAIALIAAAVSLENYLELEIHGIDRAELSPETAAQAQTERLELIRFHPRTTVESMPFEDDSVALISSQYGIEYADRDAALDECARILKPGGHLMAITHSDDSKVMAQTEIDLADGDLLIDELDLVGKYKALLRAERRANADGGPERAKAEFQRAAARVVHEIRGRDEKQAKFLNEVMHRFGEAYEERSVDDPEGSLRAADEIELELETHRRRLLDLSEAALNSADLDSWRRAAAKRGFECLASEAVFNASGGKVGHRLEFVLASN